MSTEKSLYWIETNSNDYVVLLVGIMYVIVSFLVAVFKEAVK